MQNLNSCVISKASRAMFAIVVAIVVVGLGSNFSAFGVPGEGPGEGGPGKLESPAADNSVALDKAAAAESARETVVERFKNLADADAPADFNDTSRRCWGDWDVMAVPATVPFKVREAFNCRCSATTSKPITKPSSLMAGSTLNRQTRV